MAWRYVYDSIMTNTTHWENSMNVRASLNFCCSFHILKLLFPQYSVGTYDTLSQKYVFSGLKLHSCIYYTINAVFFYYLWCFTMYKRQYIDKTLMLWKSMNMRASGTCKLRKCWHFYIIKVLFLSIWMGVEERPITNKHCKAYFNNA